MRWRQQVSDFQDSTINLSRPGRFHFRRDRFGIYFNFLGLYLLYSFVLRTALTFRSWGQIGHSPLLLLKIFSIGMLFDLVSGSYVLIPFTIYLLVVPRSIFISRWNSWLMGGMFFVALYGLGISTMAEWLFWSEFGTRFNFIVVDYIVYTHEVLGNIWESYPIPLMLGGLFLLTGLVLIAARNGLSRFFLVGQKREQFFAGLGGKEGIVFLLLPVFFFFSVSSAMTSSMPGRYEKELAENGLYQLFRAFRTNSLDYQTFYKTQDPAKVSTTLRTLLDNGKDQFVSKKLLDQERQIVSSGPEKKPNVVLVMMESMSAEFLKAFGNTSGITPNLDHLAKSGLLFTDFYATGTRTVRGIEAVTLSVPPTPGRSIVKRPDNAGMFSVGNVFGSKGYARTFFYGGYGYFDNMNAFFSGNGFKIVDRNSLSADEIGFANIWGVCDEDLFRRAIKDFDKSFQKDKPFFGYLMTTSNHRPYSYPDGRIDIASHEGRAGGVKYADYAIGEFIKEAKSRPWFDNTIFVFVADHCAGSAGREELPVYRYRIPLIFYSPKLIKPATNNSLASQIDVAPTLFAMMNWSYRSKFMGQNILGKEFVPRAFIGNYQKLGYVKNNVLTILTERGIADQFKIHDETLQNVQLEEVKPAEKLVNEAIAYYQGASLINRNRLNRRDDPKVN